ncbi:hypothetical protein [Streptomyces sp. NPDC021212]|uniref:hypothetical protein n=1 Tax=Streptomyces sp. NPDC021212 TaxID=3365118 RepID=UPI0037A63060
MLAAFADLERQGEAAGPVLVAFQVGDEPLRVAEPFGHPVSLGFRRLSPDGIAGLLRGAGFALRARHVREPEGREKVPQAILLARKPEAG